jgi:hypothetical protein
MAAGQRMKDDLTAMAIQDGVSIPANPTSSLSRLIEQYIPDHGGYLFYALLNSAGEALIRARPAPSSSTARREAASTTTSRASTTCAYL